MLPAAAPATVAVGSSFAEWAKSESVEGVDAELCAPWMFDLNGAAVRLPAEAIGLRVRYWPEGARGIGEVVDDDDGQPVFVPRNATLAQFRELVGYRPGRYKLIALDRSFQFLERVPLVTTTIKPSTAARAGVTVRGGASASEGPSVDTISQVLAFLERVNAQAFNQIGSVQREFAETQRATMAQLGGVIGPVASVLSAAGSSGVVKKTLTLDAAAAGAPVTVQMMSAGEMPATPRNAASTATVAAASTEKGGGLEAALSLFVPLFEKAAPVAAYGLAQKLDLPDHVARDLAGVARATVQTAGQMLSAHDPEEAAAAVSGAAAVVSAAELGAHAMRIQLGLPEEDRAWIGSLMARCPALVDALKPAVASVTVDEGIAAVRTLHAIDRALATTNERRLFGEMIKPSVLPTVFRPVLVERTASEAIDLLREQAAAMPSS